MSAVKTSFDSKIINKNLKNLRDKKDEKIQNKQMWVGTNSIFIISICSLLYSLFFLKLIIGFLTILDYQTY